MISNLQSILTGEKLVNGNKHEPNTSYSLGYNSPNTIEEFKYVLETKSGNKILVKVQPDLHSVVGKDYSIIPKIDTILEQKETTIGLMYNGNCYSYCGKREEINGTLKKEATKINVGELKKFFILYGIKR